MIATTDLDEGLKLLLDVRLALVHTGLQGLDVVLQLPRLAAQVVHREPAGAGQRVPQLVGKVQQLVSLLDGLVHQVVQEGHSGLVGPGVHQLVQGGHLEAQGVACIAAL